MRLHGQAQADQMRMRSLVQGGISTVSGMISDLELSLAPVATSGSYDDLTDKPALGALASMNSITTTKISNWSSATSGFLTEASLTPYAKTGDLAAVALSGAYADLTDTPTLGALASQDSVTHSQISDWNSATSIFARKETTTKKLTIAASATYGLAVYLYRRDNLVIAQFKGTAKNIPKGVWLTIATIADSDFFPAEATPYQTLVPQSKADEPFLVRVMPTGAIDVNATLAALDGYVNDAIFYFAA